MSKQPPTILTQAASIMSGGPSLAEDFLKDTHQATDPAAREIALSLLHAFTNYARTRLQDRVLEQAMAMGLGKDAPHHPDIPRGGVVVPKPGGYPVPLEGTGFQITKERADTLTTAVVQIGKKATTH